MSRKTMCGPPPEGWREDVKIQSKMPFDPGYDQLWRMPETPPRSKLLWAGIDLDGTLAAPLWTPENPTSEIGDPIPENVAKLMALVEAGYKPVIHTSRPWTDYERIERWLEFHGIPWKAIQCGKPLFAVYIDDRGKHSEEESWMPHGQS